ncbi:MAG: transposase [Candidatus Syntropharchaeia archaeon]
MAIDLGFSNLATVVVEDETQAYIFDGRILLSKLRWFAKEKARIQSVISKQGYKHSRKHHCLIVKEHAYVRDYPHKISRWIVKLARDKNVGRIVVGNMFEVVDEAYTSQTCFVCDTKDKSNRKHRGLYVCKHCGVVLNADVNGARNILFRVVPSVSEEDRDSGLGHPR